MTRVREQNYQYPESKNPYWGKIKNLETSTVQALTDQATERHRGHWKNVILPPEKAQKAELHVEIGCNGGHVVLEWAARDPNNGYIGLDWKFKQIYRGYEKALRRSISNVTFLRANAERLQYIFAPSEVDHLYLYFPDPWPKKSQWKNRLVTSEWLKKIASLVRVGGSLHIKTDHAGYFEWMLEAVDGASDVWEIRESTQDLHNGQKDVAQLQIPEVTLFERIFIQQGIKICSLKLGRKESLSQETKDKQPLHHH